MIIKPVWPTWAVGALFRGARLRNMQLDNVDDNKMMMIISPTTR
jgi:hypothetical protein